MDLEIRTGDGAVTGSYFYKKVGREIPLSGKLAGKALIDELGKKNSETAAFTLMDFGDYSFARKNIVSTNYYWDDNRGTPVGFDLLSQFRFGHQKSFTIASDFPVSCRLWTAISI
jgi:hypothetical protein